MPEVRQHHRHYPPTEQCRTRHQSQDRTGRRILARRDNTVTTIHALRLLHLLDPLGGLSQHGTLLLIRQPGEEADLPRPRFGRESRCPWYFEGVEAVGLLLLLDSIAEVRKAVGSGSRAQGVGLSMRQNRNAKRIPGLHGCQCQSKVACPGKTKNHTGRKGKTRQNQRQNQEQLLLELPNKAHDTHYVSLLGNVRVQPEGSLNESTGTQSTG